MHQRYLAAAGLAFLLSACALGPDAATAPPQLLLLGEQHDAATHPARQLAAVSELAARGRLAALALEMAEAGHSTTALPRDATEAIIRERLQWNDAAWPWARYGAVVMAAVRAGAPVVGANLPRSQMRAAMQDAALDGLLPPAALARQQQAIRDGHCGLLPESQIGPMVRIQVARDRAMAQALAGAARPGQTAVLIAGGGHVDHELGVPRHLPGELRIESITLPAEPTGKDYCEQLRRQLPVPGARP